MSLSGPSFIKCESSGPPFLTPTAAKCELKCWQLKMHTFPELAYTVRLDFAHIAQFAKQHVYNMEVLTWIL